MAWGWRSSLALSGDARCVREGISEERSRPSPTAAAVVVAPAPLRDHSVVGSCWDSSPSARWGWGGGLPGAVVRLGCPRPGRRRLTCPAWVMEWRRCFVAEGGGSGLRSPAALDLCFFVEGVPLAAWVFLSPGDRYFVRRGSAGRWRRSRRQVCGDVHCPGVGVLLTRRSLSSRSALSAGLCWMREPLAAASSSVQKAVNSPLVSCVPPWGWRDLGTG